MIDVRKTDREDSNSQTRLTTMQNLLCALLLLIPAAAAQADAIDDALAAQERPTADVTRDASSRPAEVLRFFGLPEQGVVVDLFGGGGYYSEIVSRAMGDRGTIYLHNNAAYLNFTGDALRERLFNDRLANVVRYDRELDAIDLADDSVDLVLMVMTYHDLYYKTDGWDLDPDSFFTMIHRILKPGAVLAIVDHAGLPGSGSAPAQTLHRIDPEFALADIEAHGFRLEAVSTILENQNDPLNMSVFDESIQGHTSKFIYKFVEPGA